MTKELSLGTALWCLGRGAALLATAGALLVMIAASNAAVPADGDRPLPPALNCSPADTADRVAIDLRGSAPPPPLWASAAAVIDADTGRALYGRNLHTRRAPASTTKIMTAIVALETMPDRNAAVVAETDASAMVGSSVMGLWPGAPLTVDELLYGLMLPSGNDAAIELARAAAGTVDAFVQRMNDKAAELGLADTHFVNPHGLDRRRHYSSAYDLAQLARYAMRDPRFRELAATRVHHLPLPFDYDLYNGNTLLDRYPGADGVKIGWTEAAGWTFVASAERDGHRLIAVLLNTADRDADAAALLDWGFGTLGQAAGRRVDMLLRIFGKFGLEQPVESWLAVCP
jgi:D-alanyl-D-alanine carboxypeptidase (penicillin-binding protein 5/6)